MGKRVAILQSNYIPWKGYFDIIGMVDEFILYDDVQYTRRDWRNRNKIKTSNGIDWLTIPVKTKGNYSQPIKEIEVSDPRWADKHWNTVRHSYGKSPGFEWCAEWLEPLYATLKTESHLSMINHGFLQAICSRLGITTPLRRSSEFNYGDGKTEKLMNICRLSGASVYLSGPSAKDYLDEEIFARAGIAVEWMEYGRYPEYEQLYPPFEHGVSIIDLLMQKGTEASTYMKWKGTRK